MKIAYVKVKREKTGPCNICLKTTSLSWDHVPPKGGIDISPIEQETILYRLTSTESERRVAVSQNGNKYRTLCESCNNELLGANYDTILNDFAIGVGRFLNTTLDLPPIVHIETKPQKLIRAVLGHLLAAKVELDDVILDKKMREIVLDENMPIPEDIRVFYWIYPYKDIVVIRDIVLQDLCRTAKGPIFVNLLKYFPIAYLVSDSELYEEIDELTAYRDLGPDETAEIPIRLDEIKHPDWPEAGNEFTLIAGGRSFVSSIHARPRRR